MKKFLLLCIIFLCGFSYTGPETELTAAINRERDAHSLAPLSINWELARLARHRAEEMQQLGFITHESFAYGNPQDMLTHFGIDYEAVGVNIAKGQDTPEEVVAAWLTSAMHTELLLDNTFTQIGVGLAHDKYMLPYWVVILASK